MASPETKSREATLMFEADKRGPYMSVRDSILRRIRADDGSMSSSDSVDVLDLEEDLRLPGVSSSCKGSDASSCGKPVNAVTKTEYRWAIPEE